jgi:hypothetical protein
MNPTQSATTLRSGKTLAMLIAASLLLLPPLWGRQSNIGKPTGSGRFVLNGNTVSVAVPRDWQVHPEDASSGFNVLLSSSFGEIAVAFASAGELRPSGEDSRRPKWLADRYAATWQLPLHQWVTPDGLEVRDTLKPGKNRNRYVASGHCSDLEFAAFGTVSSSHDLKVVRNALASFLASAEYSSKPSRPKVLVSGMKRTVSVRQVPKSIAPRVLTLGGRRLTLPGGWVTYDMILPGTFLKATKGQPYQLDLVKIAPPNARVNLVMKWATAPPDSEARRAFLHQSKVQSQKWRESGYIVRDLSKANNKPDAVSFYQMRTRGRAGKGTGAAERIELLSLSTGSTVYGKAVGLEEDGNIEDIQKAFDAVRRQIQ